MDLQYVCLKILTGLAIKTQYESV